MCTGATGHTLVAVEYGAARAARQAEEGNNGY